MSFFRPTVFTKSENCPSEVPPTAGRRGTLSPEPPLSATLHEAILASSSSVRDSLPEQHRAHFETLRQEIIDFAQAHNIPRESLAKPQDLQEAAKKLSTPDLERLATLLERFEYLVKHKEPAKEELSLVETLEYAENFYNLREQYEDQIELLHKEGFLDHMKNLSRPVPTLEQIAKRLYERRETLEIKQDQGFTRLLLVPFATGLGFFVSVVQEFLGEYRKEHPDFTLGDFRRRFMSYDFDILPGDTGIKSSMMYYPTSAGFYVPGHGGKTKKEILEAEDQDQGKLAPGWRVLLLQAPHDSAPGFCGISKEKIGRVRGIKKPRPDREGRYAPWNDIDFLEASRQDPSSPYFGESGMTLEDWIVAFMTHLEATGKPLDEYEDKKSLAVNLAGCISLTAKGVPNIFWDHTDRRIVTRVDNVEDYVQIEAGSRFVVEI